MFIEIKLQRLQIELIDVSGNELEVERIGGEITDLREQRQQVLIEVAERHDVKERMNDKTVVTLKSGLV